MNQAICECFTLILPRSSQAILAGGVVTEQLILTDHFPTMLTKLGVALDAQSNRLRGQALGPDIPSCGDLGKTYEYNATMFSAGWTFNTKAMPEAPPALQGIGEIEYS